MQAVVAPAVRAFHAAFPEVELKLRTAAWREGARLLADGRSDLHCGGIDTGEALPAHLRRKRFLDVTAGIVAASGRKLVPFPAGRGGRVNPTARPSEVSATSRFPVSRISPWPHPGTLCHRSVVWSGPLGPTPIGGQSSKPLDTPVASRRFANSRSFTNSFALYGKCKQSFKTAGRSRRLPNKGLTG